MAAALIGPIPGTRCNHSTVTEFKSRAAADLFCPSAEGQNECSTRRESLLNAIALRIIFSDFAEQGRLICD